MGDILAFQENLDLARARAGSGAAFGALISPYHTGLYRRALKITQNPEDAEDIVQDAELKAYCRLEQFQGNARFGTWVMRILINEALMMLRRRRISRETLGLSSNAKVEACRSCPPPGHQDYAYPAVELRGILDRALACLSPPLRHTFLLCYLEGYSPQEAASMLNLSVAGVKSRLLRARRKLHQRLITLLKPYGGAADLPRFRTHSSRAA